MKKILFLVLFFISAPFSFAQNSFHKTLPLLEINKEIALKFGATIHQADLKKLLNDIASKEFEGRKIGEIGQKKAANYLKKFYVERNISTPLENGNYFQTFDISNLKANFSTSENVVAFIKGIEKPEEIIVISAHYDHLGINNNKIYVGADDDGSGTVAVLEIAEAFQQAVENGFPPKRSILFIHFSGEEKGLLGSKYYASHPIFPLKNTITNFNIDMVGRIDNKHKNNQNYLYLIGSDKLSKTLHKISEEINAEFSQLQLDYTYNSDNDPNRFYYRSDHFSFAKNNIPVIFYFNGTHEDYHKPTDTPDKINYLLLSKRTQLIFYTAWEIANRNESISADK